jgi:hypothetical protein
MHWDEYNKGNVTEKRVDEGKVEGEMEDKTVDTLFRGTAREKDLPMKPRPSRWA